MTHNENEYGTKWLRFYVYWRFPISFFFSAVTILENFESTYFGSPLMIAALLLDLGLLALHVAVYVLMRRMRTIGYQLNYVSLSLEAVVFAINEAAKEFPSFPSKSFTFFLALALFLLIWVVPNFIYFRHRSYLFPFSREHPFSAPYQKAELSTFINFQRGSVIVENAARGAPDKTAEATPRLLPDREKAMRYCRSCGAPLLPGARFCTNCGLDLQTLYYTAEDWN